MHTELLFKHIQKHISLSAEDKVLLLKSFEEITAKRNEFLLHQGDSCHYIYFINAGLLRSFHLSSDGKDATVMFALQDWWITDMHCFVNELPATMSIQAVEETTVLRISKRNLDALFEQIPEFNKLFRILMQNAYCREQNRIIQNLSLTAKERYEQFMTKYPQIVRQVTQKQIASYLGITPEFLSMIRARKK